MKERFNNRIRSYLFLSVVLLLVFNTLSMLKSLDVVKGYIEYNTEYNAVEFKNTYEDTFEFEEYYASNFSEYSRYYVSQWHQIIDVIYDGVDKEKNAEFFYAYLDKVEAKTNLSIELVNLASKVRYYPTEDVRGNNYFSTFNFEEIKKTLYREGNVLYESLNDTEYKTTKVVKDADGIVLSVSYSTDPSRFNPSIKDKEQHVSDALKLLASEDKNVYRYYVLNEDNQALFAMTASEESKEIQIHDDHANDLLSGKGLQARFNYSGAIVLDGQVLDNHSIHLLPLSDGNRMLLVLDDTEFFNAMNEMKFMALLISLVGVVILYIIGAVIIMVIEKNELTARRVTRSSQSNRLLVLMFAILIFLNGMAIIQISKIIFFHGYEAAAIDSLDKYVAYIERKETSFKRFLEVIRDDASNESELIVEGLSLFGELPKDKPVEVLPNQVIEYLPSLSEYTSRDEAIQKELLEKGRYEYFKAPKLFYKDDFETFYENYVLEPLVGDHMHKIERVVIFPDDSGEGYIRLTKSIRKQMILLGRLRTEFRDVCRAEEKELFISNLTIYNDTGTVVISHDGQEKFESRKLKDELTNYPLWFWYQFRHDELFRTVVKTVDGTYDEQYSLVSYSEPLEYYFVYKMDRKTLFLEMERLYNIYVSAIMFLLVSVFLTLGVKIKIEKRG